MIGLGSDKKCRTQSSDTNKKCSTNTRKILHQMKVWILKWGYYRMCETLLEFWNLFKVDEDSVPLTFVTYECQSFFCDLHDVKRFSENKNEITLKTRSTCICCTYIFFANVVPIFCSSLTELPSSQCKLDLGAARKSVTSNVYFCAASSYFPHNFVEAYSC